MQRKNPLPIQITEHHLTGGDVILLIALGFILGVILGTTDSFGRLVFGQELPQAGGSFMAMCSPQWPCDKSLKALENAPVKRVGLLLETFRKEPGVCPCLTKFLSQPGDKYLRIHLTNGTCFRERGRRCGPQELFHGLSLKEADSKLRRSDKRLMARLRGSIARARGLLPDPLPENLTLRVSPTLESPFSAAARQVMLKEVEAVGFAREVLVDSVLSQKCLSGYICEKHGAYPKVKPPCITDTDGVNFLELDIARHAKSSPECEAHFLWHPSFNLLEEAPMSKTFVDPLKRKQRPAAWVLLALSVLLQRP